METTLKLATLAFPSKAHFVSYIYEVEVSYSLTPITQTLSFSTTLTL